LGCSAWEPFIYYFIVDIIPFQKSGGKLASGFALADDDEGPSKKKRRIIQRNERPTVSSQFRGVDTTAIKKVS
jgi:hypothetical protein